MRVRVQPAQLGIVTAQIGLPAAYHPPGRRPTRARGAGADDAVEREGAKVRASDLGIAEAAHLVAEAQQGGLVEVAGVDPIRQDRVRLLIVYPGSGLRSASDNSATISTSGRSAGMAHSASRIT